MIAADKTNAGRTYLRTLAMRAIHQLRTPNSAVDYIREIEKMDNRKPPWIKNRNCLANIF
jgi:hypothetical protein